MRGTAADLGTSHELRHRSNAKKERLTFQHSKDCAGSPLLTILSEARRIDRADTCGSIAAGTTSPAHKPTAASMSQDSQQYLVALLILVEL